MIITDMKGLFGATTTGDKLAFRNFHCRKSSAERALKK